MKLFKLSSQISYISPSEEKVIPHAAMGTFVTLNNLIEDAKKELEHLKQDFEKQQLEEIEEKKKEAYQEALTIFNQHIFALDAEVKTLKIHLMKQVLPLALSAAKKIVAEQLTLHPDTIVAIIQKQLTQCASCKKVKIIVSKQDKQILDDHKPELKAMLDQVESFAIEEASHIDEGSCLIETEAGTINASIDLQWKALEKAFQRFMKTS